MPKNFLVLFMFGVSYLNLSAHLSLNLILGVLSIFVIGANNNAVLFFLLFLVILKSFVADLMPHHKTGWNQIPNIILEEFLPTVLILLVLSLLSKESVPWKGVFIALLVLLAFSLFLKGILSFAGSWVHLKIAQLVTGFVALVFLGGIFLVPPLLSILENYETKNKIYLFFAQSNPLIVISNLFGIDPFHKDQLYHYFGSNFLVPKMDGIYSLAILGLFAGIFWLMIGFWGKEEGFSQSAQRHREK